MSPGRRRLSREKQPAQPQRDEVKERLDRIDAQATEVLGHMYQAALAVPEFTLADGTRCEVEGFYGPERNAEGKLKCGIDVTLSDGTQLEYTVGHTGWGRSFVDQVLKSRRKGGRGR